jgi:hypothetical protein
MSHYKSHEMSSTTDHSATSWRLFHSNGSGEVVELALGDAGKPLIGGGTTAAPAWGAVLLASAVVTAAGATPEDSDVAAWASNTVGIVVGTGGAIWLTFKNGTDVYYVQMVEL